MEEQLLAVAAAAAGGRCGMEREQSRWLLFYITVLGVLEMEGAFVFVAVQAAGRESFRRLSRAVCRDCECARCVGISLYCPNKSKSLSCTFPIGHVCPKIWAREGRHLLGARWSSSLPLHHRLPASQMTSRSASTSRR